MVYFFSVSWDIHVKLPKCQSPGITRQDFCCLQKEALRSSAVHSPLEYSSVSLLSLLKSFRCVLISPSSISDVSQNQGQSSSCRWSRQNRICSPWWSRKFPPILAKTSHQCCSLICGQWKLYHVCLLNHVFLYGWVPSPPHPAQGHDLMFVYPRARLAQFSHSLYLLKWLRVQSWPSSCPSGFGSILFLIFIFSRA